jgi:6-phosphogluconate dehydrogenase
LLEIAQLQCLSINSPFFTIRKFINYKNIIATFMLLNCIKMAQFGMIGLGTMGRNLAYNVADHNFSVCGYDRDEAQRNRFLQEAPVNKQVQAVASLQEFVSALEAPRKIMLLVPAGKIVDAVLTDLLPLLQKDDIVIDGGNSHFTDTDRRYAQLQTTGVHFMGMGVSGGEDGARLGPSMMPGSNEQSYNEVKNILESIAATTETGRCVTFIGNGAAGHYTKMVHNGIEYAIMQLISEIYGVLKNIGKLSNAELHTVFAEWNKTELQSFLVEITGKIFLQKDDKTSNDLVDMILDKAKQKGTGMWTSQSAMDLNIPIPTIDVAVSMRYISAFKSERVVTASIFNNDSTNQIIDKNSLIAQCKNALQCCITLSYAQGLHLLQAASAANQYNINIAEVVRIWTGGCIIRSVLLKDLHIAYTAEPTLTNIIHSKVFTQRFIDHKKDLKNIIVVALQNNLPIAALSATLNYFNAYTSANLPANLIQAQRDFFGAHTYERVDSTGSFHTEWN